MSATEYLFLELTDMWCRYHVSYQELFFYVSRYSGVYIVCHNLMHVSYYTFSSIRTDTLYQVYRVSYHTSSYRSTDRLHDMRAMYQLPLLFPARLFKKKKKSDSKAD